MAVPTSKVKMKICAVGEEAVGKTSLIRRFVADAFEGEYVRTIGTLLTKKTVEIEGRENQPMVADVVLWDIMGRQSFMDLLQDAYFYNANGIFAVLDITRKEDLKGLRLWLRVVFEAIGSAPVVILANKSDLSNQREVSDDDLAALAESYDAPHYLTSAKTGENVKEAIEGLIRLVLERGEGPIPVSPLKGRPWERIERLPSPQS